MRWLLPVLFIGAVLAHGHGRKNDSSKRGTSSKNHYGFKSEGSHRQKKLATLPKIQKATAAPKKLVAVQPFPQPVPKEVKLPVALVDPVPLPPKPVVLSVALVDLVHPQLVNLPEVTAAPKAVLESGSIKD